MAAVTSVDSRRMSLPEQMVRYIVNHANKSEPDADQAQEPNQLKRATKRGAAPTVHYRTEAAAVRLVHAQRCKTRSGEAPTPAQ